MRVNVLSKTPMLYVSNAVSENRTRACSLARSRPTTKLWPLHFSRVLHDYTYFSNYCKSAPPPRFELGTSWSEARRSIH